MMMLASAPLMGQAQTALRSGIDLTYMDLTVNPADDFYQYACGGWMKKNPLPAAYSRFGSFDQLGENNNKRVNDILTDLLNNTYPQGTTEQKLSDFYKLAMDSIRLNKEGVKPLLPLLSAMEKAKDVKALKVLQLKHIGEGYGIPMGLGFGADEKNATMNILNIYQGGLTLGEKGYYLDADTATTAIREAYKKHVVRMFKLFGFNEKVAQQKMKNIVAFETALAKISRGRAELRDVEANYNKMSLADFKKKYAHIPLEEWMNADGVKSAYFQELVVGQPDFLAGVDRLMARIPINTLKAYMQWHAMMTAASYLGDEVEAANFDFFGKTMRGRKENYPRWKRATGAVEEQMGEALGVIYTRRYFPASSKIRMETLVRNLQVALGERINQQTWMSEATKKAALEKLNTFYVKIGYPDKWKDMSGLQIDPAKSYYENAMACRKFWNQFDLKHKAGQPVDRDEWHMTPQTVNAYYNPTTNEICFPAGILQPPFFDPTADDAFNYGAIGVVIGHEMTHGFDDQGRHYDKNGNMTDWWQQSDVDNFTVRADKYADYFSGIKVLPDLNADGHFTLGENLADHGGLQVSYEAFKQALKNSPLETIDGLTPEQRFFIAYAGVWAGNITELEIRNRTKNDPHSLGRWRVNGALPHIDMWYEAFNVTKDNQLFIPKAERLELW